MNDTVHERARAAVDATLRECLGLLNSVRFDLVKCVYARGENSAASVVMHSDPRDSKVRRVLVVCHVAGHLSVDWRGVGILLRNVKSGDLFPGFLDAKGRAEFRFPASMEAEFVIQTSLSSVLVGTAGKLLAYAASARPDIAEDKATTQREHLFDYEVSSGDGAVVASARQHPGGVIEIRIRALNQALKNGVALLEFRSASKTIWQETIRLNLEDLKGPYGVWFGELTLPEDAAMHVVAFPARRS
jgi:hypothetical protein